MSGAAALVEVGKNAISVKRNPANFWVPSGGGGCRRRWWWRW
jgi:hypothetical protein